MDIYKWINSRIRKEGAPSQVELPFNPSSRDLINATVNLQKALAKDKLNELKTEWHEEDLGNLVDEHHHHFNSEMPSGFFNVLTDPKEYGFISHGKQKERQQVGVVDQGISPKLISDTPHGIFMIKPYHSSDKVEGKGHMPSEVPFSGFNIMLAKNLYDKANLGHMIENVSSIPGRSGSEINFPVTVHKFHDPNEYGLGSNLGHRGFTAEGDKPTVAVNDSAKLGTWDGSDPFRDKIEDIDNPYKINPLQAKQMAAMDYLLGNVDRHRNNWLVSRNFDPESGYRNIVAFDHDRLFNYRDFESPSTFIDALQQKGPARELKDAHYSQYHPSDDEFKKWWAENKEPLKREMDRQLSYIKDDGTRRYIRSNFNSRFDSIDQWARTDPNTPISEADYEHDTIKFARVPEEEMHQILQKLPPSPNEALDAVLSVFPNEYKTPSMDERMKNPNRNYWGEEVRNRGRRVGLTEIASAIVQNANPSHAGYLISKFNMGDAEHNIARNSILDDLMANPEIHREHLENILEHAKKNPSIMSPYRAKKLEEILKAK